MYCSIKMSLRNNFRSFNNLNSMLHEHCKDYESVRLFFITAIFLSIIDTHSTFTLRRTTSSSDSYDLAQEESVILEVKHDLKRINDVPMDVSKTTDAIKPSDVMESTQKMPQTAMIMTSTSNLFLTTELLTETTTDKATESLESVPQSTTQINEFTESGDIKKDVTTLTTIKEPSSIPISSNTFLTSDTTFQGPKGMKIYEVTQPFRKKYTTIERIRATPTTPTVLLSTETSTSNRIENVGKTERKPSRVSLQDASDIGSLEKLKIELLLTTMKQQAAEKQTPTTLLMEHTTTDEPINSTFSTSETLTYTESSTPSVPKYGVESKRAGYLDFSPKTTVGGVSSDKVKFDFKNDERQRLRAMFEVETDTEVPDEKTEYRLESQSQLTEDALKEELLKEDILSNNEENAKRFREESSTTQEMNLDSDTEIYKSQDITKNRTSSVDTLKVKPLNMNTEKNTVLYPVNPNYKPLKKIDVQPPKLVLRDPDDNTWRNESLSSLGIVFKPKNSSKPFTQVLKNKTESEWNNLSEKDSTSDTPDLKERLHKMAETRKSKRKKTDSFGNVVYFDYEENNGSGESVSLSKEEVNKNISTTTPLVSSFVNSSSVSSDQPEEITTPSTVDAAFAKEFKVSSTEKPKKFFNVPDYYDNTDDDDIDYLNMAKIDIKKFTTSKMTPNTPTTQTLPRLKVEDKKPHITFPERKATLQYFPPLKTHKTDIIDYDNDFKMKLDSYTTLADQPKLVLPVSTSTTSIMTPEYRTTAKYNNYKSNRNDFSVTTKPNFIKDFYLTRPPMTTEGSTSPGDGRDSYMIKHYRDFVNQAAKDADYDKNNDYSPFTDVPVQGVTKTEFDIYDKKITKINIGDDYDDDAQFRKDVLQRFVNNFNHNTDRFKSDFPVLFNNSVIHGQGPNGRDIASSRAFMRGLYENRLSSRGRGCEPHCDFTVELSPAYELHYYVPDEEERQEAVRPATTSYQNM